MPTPALFNPSSKQILVLKMDELAELQALLGAVQKQEVKYRLNERNCKELLVKLIEKKLVELIVTLVNPYSIIRHT